MASRSIRQIALDTETTGLDARLGHRVIEIAAVEIVNRQLTGEYFHRYLNPDRDSDPGALEIHGLTRDFLSDKPRFGDVAGDLLAFVSGAELVIHNAAFDVEFLDAELGAIGQPPIARHCPSIVDSLALARELRPGKRNSLDALCEAYGVDRSSRVRHGALIDTRLLAQVYLAMTRGQDSLVIDAAAAAIDAQGSERWSPEGLALPVIEADAQEAAAHEARLDALDRAARGGALWRRVPAQG
jgi:DNA polymerase-3 subunit epsilon